MRADLKEKYGHLALPPVRRRDYNATAHFYSRPGTNEPSAFRSVLDMTAKCGLRSCESAPDLHVVTMNPGEGKPCDPCYGDWPVWVPGQEKHLVAAIPDRNQNQILRILKAFGWTQARVLNLFDFRTQDSNELYARVGRQRELTIDSIFHPEREAELRLALGTQGPVLLAWGTADELETAACRALVMLNRLCPGRIVGLCTGDWRYYYPSPRFQPHNVWFHAAVDAIREHLRRNLSV
jgi:hypothetical protein